MTPEQAKRLLNVARACRETSFPDDFDMGRFAYNCRTPGCAIGNYAARADLQSRYALAPTIDCAGGELIVDGQLRTLSQVLPIVAKDFGISEQEAFELFAANGCRFATTANEAADYIERFVRERCPEAQP